MMLCTNDVRKATRSYNQHWLYTATLDYPRWQIQAWADWASPTDQKYRGCISAGTGGAAAACPNNITGEQVTGIHTVPPIFL